MVEDGAFRSDMPVDDCTHAGIAQGEESPTPEVRIEAQTGVVQPDAADAGEVHPSHQFVGEREIEIDVGILYIPTNIVQSGFPSDICSPQQFDGDSALGSEMCVFP